MGDIQKEKSMLWDMTYMVYDREGKVKGDLKIFAMHDHKIRAVTKQDTEVKEQCMKCACVYVKEYKLKQVISIIL